jgi:hypothetical protein
MAEHIDGYTITASNASVKASQQGNVTVRDSSGEILARVYTHRSQPLKWLRRWVDSKERKELVAQLQKANVSAETITRIVSL